MSVCPSQYCSHSTPIILYMSASAPHTYSLKQSDAVVKSYGRPTVVNESARATHIVIAGPPSQPVSRVSIFSFSLRLQRLQGRLACILCGPAVCVCGPEAGLMCCQRLGLRLGHRPSTGQRSLLHALLGRDWSVQLGSTSHTDTHTQCHKTALCRMHKHRSQNYCNNYHEQQSIKPSSNCR